MDTSGVNTDTPYRNAELYVWTAVVEGVKVIRGFVTGNVLLLPLLQVHSQDKVSFVPK